VTTKEGPVDLIALVKDVAEPLFHATIEVPVITLALLFFWGLFMGWFMSHYRECGAMTHRRLGLVLLILPWAPPVVVK